VRSQTANDDDVRSRADSDRSAGAMRAWAAATGSWARTASSGAVYRSVYLTGTSCRFAGRVISTGLPLTAVDQRSATDERKKKRKKKAGGLIEIHCAYALAP